MATNDGRLEVGVICDDYKYNFWKKKLEESKWEIVYQGAGITKNTRVFKLLVPPMELPELKKLLQKMDVDFKRSN